MPLFFTQHLREKRPAQPTTVEEENKNRSKPEVSVNRVNFYELPYTEFNRRLVSSVCRAPDYRAGGRRRFKSRPDHQPGIKITGKIMLAVPFQT